MMTLKNTVPLSLLLLAGLCTLMQPQASMAAGQDVRGAVAGTVRDSNGAVIPRAAISVEAVGSGLKRAATTNSQGEFRVESLPPGVYRLSASAPAFAQSVSDLAIPVGSTPSIPVVLKPAGTSEVLTVSGQGSLTAQPMEATSSVQKTVISSVDLATLPLASRSFANIGYMAPMTQPVEPSDPTKARISAVAFAGSSGLNVDLSVDGGDNNDDYIGGFLQNYSPDAINDFTVRTAQFDADTSRTNGGSVIISTRRGYDQWHGGGAFYFTGRTLQATDSPHNPQPHPHPPDSRRNGVFYAGGPIQK